MKDNAEKFWKYVKSKRQDEIGIRTLKKDGLIFDTSKDKADILNKQFHSMYTKEDSSNISSKGVSPTPSIGHLKVTTAGVLKLLQRLKPNKASGPDQIHIRLLKSASDEIAPVLCSIFQQSLDNGELPQDWKHALVTPIYKKNGRQNPGNYRPISLTSVSCKLLEHIISSHIMNHLNKYDLSCPFQHGFRHHHSTETQLILTIHDLSTSIDRGNQVG